MVGSTGRPPLRLRRPPNTTPPTSRAPVHLIRRPARYVPSTRLPPTRSNSYRSELSSWQQKHSWQTGIVFVFREMKSGKMPGPALPVDTAPCRRVTPLPGRADPGSDDGCCGTCPTPVAEPPTSRVRTAWPAHRVNVPNPRVEDPTNPGTPGAGLQGLIFGVVKAAVDRAGARGCRGVTHESP